MTHELKQRLIGAVVITAIAAIFLPMLFDDPVQESVKTIDDIAIPPPPQVAAPAPMAPAGLAGTQEEAGLNARQDNGFENEAYSPDDFESEALADKNAAAKMRAEEGRDVNGKVDKGALAVAANRDKSSNDKTRRDRLDADLKAKAKLEAAQQAEYEALAKLKAKEKAEADKLAAQKRAEEARAEARQQLLDDKAAKDKLAADKAAAKKAHPDAPINVHWYVRVGSYSQESNAISLKDRLRKQGYPAVVDVINSAAKGKLYRLRVGPEASKPAAAKLKQKVDAVAHSKSILELE